MHGTERSCACSKYVAKEGAQDAAVFQLASLHTDFNKLVFTAKYYAVFGADVQSEELHHPCTAV